MARSFQTARAAVLSGTALMLAVAGCAPTDLTVASDHCKGDTCGKDSKRKPIEEVDILLAIDSSASIDPAAQRLKQQLPRLINAIVTGEDQEGDASFPPAQSVHVAVVSSDMGIGLASVSNAGDIGGCSEKGDDGIFFTPAEAELACDDASYPGFLQYERGSASLATVDSVACVPLVGSEGCGFEQPLEAVLKALAPSDFAGVEFVQGEGHGDGANEGFLREDSLLVVVVVTDEDDCSTADQELFAVRGGPYQDLPVNQRCALETEALYDLDRFQDGLERLRPNNDNVVFATIGGFPMDLVRDANELRGDASSEEQLEAYYELLANDDRMVPRSSAEDPADLGGYILPSCESDEITAAPPVRLLEMTSRFGPRGVVGSLCAEDFGGTTGQLIHAIGRRLSESAEESVAVEMD